MTGMIDGLLIALHSIGAAIWVGGMFFAHQCLRPAALQLSAAPRCQLWTGTLQRFLRWVWAIVVVIPVSGYLMLFGRLNGFSSAHWNVHIMQMLGLVMIGIFLWVFYKPFRAFQQLTTAQNFDAALKALAQIRRLVGWNLSLGLATILVAVGGRFW